MPFVKRDTEGQIIGMSIETGSGCEEELLPDDAELQAFVRSQAPDEDLGSTDQDFIRVLEDVVELLISKGIILFTDLPQSAQQKIMRRQQLRSELSGKLDLIGDD